MIDSLLPSLALINLLQNSCDHNYKQTMRKSYLSLKFGKISMNQSDSKLVIFQILEFYDWFEMRRNTVNWKNKFDKKYKKMKRHYALQIVIFKPSKYYISERKLRQNIKEQNMTKEELRNRNEKAGEDQNDDSELDLIEVCQQFCVIGPLDIQSSSAKFQQMETLKGELFSKDRFVQFVEGNIRKLGHSNARLLYRIKTEYFWNGAGNHMLLNVLDDSRMLSSTLSTLISQRNGMIKLTKYQVYLMICHMLMGTFPRQLYLQDPSFGNLLAVRDNEDQLTCKDQIEFRLNKLKALIRYICVFFKRSKLNPHYGKKQYVIFQRHYDPFQFSKDPITHLTITDDTTRLCKVQPMIGDYYRNDHQIDAISINNCATAVPGSQVMHVSASKFDLEDRIFLSHPEMMVLPILLYDPLGEGEALLIHGAEKFTELDAISPYEQFSFSQNCLDKSKIDGFHQCRKTTFMFINRTSTPKNIPHQVVPDVWKIYSGLKGCSFLHSPSTSLISGKFRAIAHKRSETPWEITFIYDWMAASLMGWKQFNFFVSDQVEVRNLSILASELKNHSPADLQRIINKFDELRLECEANIRFLTFLQDFVV